MRPSPFLPVLLGALGALAAPAFAKEAPKCAKGEVASHGACAPACPTEGTIADPAACECPAGFGKVLFGGGGGECKPLACPAHGDFDAKKLCECPPGEARKASTRGGKAHCESVTAARAP